MTVTTQLTIVERVRKALTVNFTEEALIAMAGETKDVKDIKDKADYQLVKTAAIKLRGTRVTIEKAGKAARDDANKFSKAVIAEQHRLVNIISDEELRLKALRQVVDDEADRIKQIAAEKEEIRVEAIQAQVAVIYKLGEGLLNSYSTDIRNRLVTLGQIDFDSFEEFHPAAEFAVESTRKSLEEGLLARVQLEEQQVEQTRVAEEQRLQQEKLDAQQAKIDEQNAEAVKQQEIENQRMAAEKAEELRKLGVEHARLKAAKDKADKEAAAKAEEERQAKLLPAKEKLLQWAGVIKNIEPPTGIRALAQKEIVEAALRALGNVGNDIITKVNDL